ncbi:MAG TPA: radical SAM protein [Methanotrichaceae archaeon]|nr:radical SAM protein [Methanotrichaceae archaeon]
MKLDSIRFRIALMCDGAFSSDNIKESLGSELNHSRRYVDQLVESTLRQFDDQKLLDWNGERLIRPYDLGDLAGPNSDGQRHLSAPLAVIWEITRRCNLRCKHCFSNSGLPESDELTTDEVKRAIDLLSEKKVFYVNFTGGEPLLRPDLIDILSYASGKKISLSLSTNGYLLTGETADLLKETNVSQVQISIDGMNEQHDLFRGVTGSFSQALKAIRLLRDAGIEVAVSTTVNKTNMDQISRIIDMSMDVGASVFKTTLFIPVGRGRSNEAELGLESDDVHRLAILMKEKENEVNGRLFLEDSSCYSWLFEDGSLAAPSWMRSKNIGCAAGKSNIFITADGNVVPCPFLRELTMGNIRRDSFDEIWDSEVLDVFRTLHTGDLTGKCGNCEHLGMRCYGGCRAAALAYNGDLLGADPFCWKQSSS